MPGQALWKAALLTSVFTVHHANFKPAISINVNSASGVMLQPQPGKLKKKKKKTKHLQPDKGQSIRWQPIIRVLTHIQ